ncbi:MAG: low temperature requirement protein A [Verrucomicrobiaceae bacterium]
MNAPSLPRVTWLELFYDLIVASAMFLVFGALSAETNWGAYGWYAAIVFLIFSIWVSTTLANSRVPDDSTTKRILVILQMFASLVAVLSTDRTGPIDDQLGILALACVFFILALLWYRVRLKLPDQKRADSVPIASSLLAGICFTTAVWVPIEWDTSVFLIGAGLGLLPFFLMYIPRLARQIPIDEHHLRERFGQLVLVMLGESFLKVMMYVTKGATPRLGGVGLVFIIVSLIWWQFFTYINPSKMPQGGARLVGYILGHALIVLGVGSAAISLSDVAVDTGDGMSPAVVGGTLGWSLALTYAGFTVITACSPRNRLVSPLFLFATFVLMECGVNLWGGQMVLGSGKSEEPVGALYAFLTGVILLISVLIYRRLTHPEEEGKTGRGITSVANI